MTAIRIRLRQMFSGARWRSWVVVLVGVGVITAMVIVAESARRDADRHLRAQVLVERVRAGDEQISSIQWEALADTYGEETRQEMVRKGLTSQGISAWNSINHSLQELQALEPGPETSALVRDANALENNGLKTLGAFLRNAAFKTVLTLDNTYFRPAVTVLETDSQHAAAVENRIARHASIRAGIAYVGSLVVGMTLLLLLGWRLHRMHRQVLIAEQERSSERRSEERIRALVEHASDAIGVIRPDLTVRWQSNSLYRLLGLDPDALVGSRITELVHPDDVAAVERHLVTAAGKPGSATLGARFEHADGSWRDLEVVADNRLSDPAVNGIVLSMRDVTHRKALEDELRHQAFHDALTGLANRALFEDRLAHALAGARRHRRPVAVLFLDLDDFKTINDSLGHASGDDLLRAAALRIGTIVRAADTAARLGGDEFAILVEILDDDDDVEVIASRILEVLASPFNVAERQLRVSASIGVAVSDGSIDVQELLRNADTAMYAAKASGKNTVQVFEEGMHLRVLDRLELTGEMRLALERDEFELEYQPIVELDTGKIRGAEALVRWQHPTRGRLNPMQFIGLAEETGLIVPLGAWILRAACVQAAEWNGHASKSPLQINVNVSTRQLHDPDFPEIVADVLADTRLDPSLLVLEITESVLPDDADATVAQLEQLKEIGVRIAVDDFGTGYSALSRLQRFPIDVVKIDRSFIEGMEHDPAKAQLVQGIMNLGESLRLEIVAEGIEEREQADQFRGMRPSLAQGFLFSRPIRGEELSELLRTGTPLVGSRPCKPLSARA